eukprot:scaffold16947_cov43-Attheya_sp.AAC.2
MARAVSLAVVCAVLSSLHVGEALHVAGGARNKAFANPNNKLGQRSSSSPSWSQTDAVAIPLDSQTWQKTEPKSKIDETDNKIQLDDHLKWIENLDYDAFRKEVADLGKELQKDSGAADVKHLERIVQWRDMAAILGVATMWSGPNPLTVMALSTWTYASWTMIAHHTCHGGYNRVDAGPFNSRGFALGSIQKRVSDWCDWMLPEAWNVEHNRLHHYHLSEPLDPDNVERNLEFLRDMNVPMPAKYAVVAALAPIWKWFYYAPNTFKELQLAQMRAEKKEMPADIDPMQPFTLRTMIFPQDDAERAISNLMKESNFFGKVLAPFMLSRFVLLPAPLLLLPGVGTTAFGHAIVNLVLAELLTNLHGFLTIVTNHCGNDMYTFDDEVKPKSGAFYVRQIISSANYKAGTDEIDFAHGWLNYQIEHHVWPDLSMLQYQRGAPRLKAICETYGVPYVQESVWMRLFKTVDIMVGRTSMIPFPTEMEPAKDKATRGVMWKSTNGAIDEGCEETPNEEFCIVS